MVTGNQVRGWAERKFPKMQEYRRHFHENPELSFQEKETSAYIRAVLEQRGILFEAGVGGPWGIVARIKGDQPGPCIAFRADMDALGIREETNLSFSSAREGVMHACGHDFHMAVLLGLAETLQEKREFVKGTVVFIFQFAEEIPPGGAVSMIEAGCLDGVDRIYGAHVDPQLPAGEVGVLEGAYMAASDSFFVDIRGGGGHGSCPYEAQDTMTTAATAILNINQIVSRLIDPLESAVISTCQIHGGVSYNVIPAVISLGGTIRTYKRETADFIRDEIEQAVKAACSMYGTEYSYRFERGYPCLRNRERETAVVKKAAERTGHCRCREIRPTMVGEDFARYLEKVPGAFFRVGVQNEKSGAAYPLHHSHFQADETGLIAALEMFLQIYLAETEQ